MTIRAVNIPMTADYPSEGSRWYEIRGNDACSAIETYTDYEIDTHDNGTYTLDSFFCDDDVSRKIRIHLEMED